MKTPRMDAGRFLMRTLFCMSRSGDGNVNFAHRPRELFLCCERRRMETASCVKQERVNDMAANLIHHESMFWYCKPGYFKAVRRTDKRPQMPDRMGIEFEDLMGLTNAEISARNAAIDGEIAKLARLLGLLVSGLGLLTLLTAVMTL
jgi:hypothetical protein